MSGNVSRKKRENLLEKIRKIRAFLDEANATAEMKAYLSEMESELKRQKFGLVFEQHREGIDEILEKNTPILTEDKSLFIDNGGTMNFIIEGDNLAALTILEKTHKGKIDVIYIDPPYNTGNKDFVYDDNCVDVNDQFRHSKWLSFMNKRLEFAKKLLANDGVIFISIDDNEYAQLKILCDSIFDERNYVTTFVWEKTQHFGRQKINYYSNKEYVLCYAKELAPTKIKELLVESINVNLQDAPLYNASNPTKTLTFPAQSVLINLPDGEYAKTSSAEYFLEKPVIVKDKKNINPLILTFKSRWSNDTVQAENKKGTTFWVKTTSFAIRTIYHEGKSSKTSPKQIIFTNNNNPMVVKSRFNEKVGVNEEASKELSGIIHQGVFSYPKPVSLIKYLLSLLYSPKTNSHNDTFTCLDFFAGSGTTGQAALEMNQADGGKRKFILCTNNENGICRDVTYERLKTIITGKRADGSSYAEQVPASLKYEKIDYISTSERAYYDYANELLGRVKELVELENAVNFEGNASLAILLTEDEAEELFMDEKKMDSVKTIYLGSDIALTSAQNCQVADNNISLNIIPQYYYKER